MKKLLLSLLGLAATGVSYGQCPLTGPATLPYIQNFNSVSGYTQNDTIFMCEPSARWEFQSPGTNAEFYMGRPSSTGGPQSDFQGVSLAMSSAADADTANIILTIDLSNITASAPEDIWLNFYYADYLDEVDAADQISVRGSSSDTWVDLINWSVGASNDWQIGRYKLDSIMTANGQSFSATTQVKFTQNDNATVTGNDGFGLDQVSIESNNTAMPTNVSISNVTATTADVSWTGSAPHTQIAFGAPGFYWPSAATQDFSGVSTGSLTGLSPATEYQVWLRDSTATGDVSLWRGPFSFTTSCVPYSAPFFTDFESTNDGDVENCWAQYNTYSSAYARVEQPTTGNATQPVSGSKFLEIYNSFSGSTDTLLAVTPSFSDMTAGDKQIRFFLASNDADNNLIIGTLDNNTPGATFSPLTSISINADNTWQEVIVPLTTANGYNGTDTYIALVHDFGGGTYDDIYIDDFYYEVIPACPKVTNVQFSNILSNGADISYNAAGDSLQIEWGPAGYTQGTGCLVDAPNNGQITLNGASNPNCAQGFAPETTYDIYVRSNCTTTGDGYSVWDGPFSFTTACAAIAAPYFNDFENDALDLDPNCWVSYATGSGAFVEVEDFTGTAAPYGGSQALYLYSAASSTSGADTLVAISPQFSDLTANDKRIRFFANSDGPNSQLIIGTISSPSANSTFTAMDTIQFAAADTYEEVILNFDAANGYNGTDEYIALVHSLGSTYQYVRIDDFNYEVVPACVGPASSSLTVNSVTSSTADVSWSAGGQGDFTKIEWGSIGFTPGSGTSAVVSGGTTNYTITGLNSQSDYEFYIQDSCIVGGAGIYLGPVSFTTACAALPTPHTESFDNTSIPTCWSTYSSTNENWLFGTNTYAPSTDHTGNGGEYANVDDSESPSSPDVTLESPLFDVTNLTNPELTFFLASADASVTLSIDVWDGTVWNTNVYSHAAASASTWDSITVNLTPFASSGTVAVRFVVDEQNGTFQNDIAIDDVTIASGPACPSPVGLNIRNISDVSATAFWPTSSTGNTYEVWYGPQGFYQGTQTTTGTKVLSSTDSLQITGLTQISCYEVLFRSICGPGDSSAWVGPVSFCTFCTNQLNGTYTIGGPAGPTNFPTIDSAVSVLNDCGVSGPVVFNIASGTYNEQVMINDITGISATNNVVFQADPANTAPVEVTYGATAAADNYVWGFNNADYVTVQGLTLTATGSTYARVIDFSGISTNIVIEDNILNGLANATTTSTNIAVIMNNTTASNRVENSSILNNQINGGSYAMYWYGVSTTDFEVGNTIDSNDIDGYYYAGIWAYYQDTFSTVGNEVTSLGVYSTEYGIRHYYNDNLTSVGNKVVVSGTATNYGYYIYYCDASSSNHSVVANNMISALDNSGTTYGMYLYNCTYMDVYNNSMLVNAGSSTGGHSAYLGGTTTIGTEVNFINNTVVNSGPGVALEVTSAAVTMVSQMDYNNYHAVGNDYANWGGTVVADLAALQTASSLDANSVSGDPVFTAPDDLHALGSNSNNAGTPLASITIDIDGDVRSTTTPDIGADEFTPLAGDLAFLSGEFVKSLCASTNDTVVFGIQNLIGPAVNFANDPLTINYTVSGPVNSSGSIVVNSGTLASQDTLVIREGGIDLSQTGVYTLDAHMLGNAVNTLLLNDTLMSVDLDVKTEFSVSPQVTNLASALDSVEICVESSFFGAGEFLITEICHFKTATGAPTTGWPSYLIADDYIEITGVPGSDLEGITLEQWDGSSMISTFTFAPGTILSPDGTAIIAIGQLGSSVESPADFYYHGNGNYTGLFSSGGNNGRILKDADGNIIDAVAAGTSYTFPAASGVTAADWSGNSGNHTSTSGIRLEGVDDNTAANWVVSTQDPNVLNANVPLPKPASAPGLTWTELGSTTVLDTLPCFIAGPYTAGGTYSYVATYTNTCGTYIDTVTVNVPNPVLDDAAMDTVFIPEDECGDSATEVYVAFTNMGANPITSMPITVTVSGAVTATLNATYTGNLPQLGSDTIMVGTVNTTVGGLTTFSAALNLGGDQDNSNDNGTTSVDFADALAPIPTAAIDTVCGTGAFDTLYFPVGTDDTYYWISTANDTLGTSDSLVVGPLGSTDTTFLLSAVAGVTYSVGPVDNSMGAAANFVNPSVQQLYFTALQEFTIKEMTVYPNANGDVHINLLDATSGTILQTVIVPVTGVTTPGTAQRISVNMTVPPGSYELHGGGSTTGGLWRNSAGASYPYSVPGVVDITGNSFGSTYYYYFYDWEISTGGCPKPNGSITIYNSGVNVSAAFTSTNGAPTASNLTVSFDASSTTGATSYTWDFGDGNTGTGMNAQNVYSSNGTYNVTLIAAGPCGSDTITNTVVIQGISLDENPLEQSLAVYPNPATDRVIVDFDLVNSSNATIRLMDAQGRVLVEVAEKAQGSKFHRTIDVSQLANGVYMIEIESGDLIAQRRLSVQ